MLSERDRIYWEQCNANKVGRDSERGDDKECTRSEGGIGGRDEGAEEGRKSMTRRGGASTLVSSLALLLHVVA